MESSLYDRVADLTAEVARLRQEVLRSGDSPARQRPPVAVRWAVTAVDPTDGDEYPDPANRPNCYPIIFMDGTYNRESGAAPLTWTDRSEAARGVAHSADESEGPYLLEGTPLPVWWAAGRWWFYLPTITYIVRTTSSVTAGHTTAYEFLTGASGAESAIDLDAVPEVYSATNLSTNTRCKITWFPGRFDGDTWVAGHYEMEPLECPPE